MVPNKHWRRLLALDLGLFNLAVFFFAFLPPNTLEIREGIIMALAGISLVGVVTHASERVRLPFDEYAYLATGTVGLLTMGVYEYYTFGNVPLVYSVSIGLFLLSGIASSWAAHVIDGGKRCHASGRHGDKSG